MSKKRFGRRFGRRKKSYTSRRHRPMLQGTLRIPYPGSAQIYSDEGTFAVASRGLRSAMDGDIVTFSLLRVPTGSSRRAPDSGHASGLRHPSKNDSNNVASSNVQACVQSVLQRKTSAFFGRYEYVSPFGVIVPLDERIPHDFLILPQDASAKAHGVHEQDVVSVRILSYPSRKEPGIVTIDKRLGCADTLDLAMESVVASYGLRTTFSDAVQAQARSIRVDVDEELHVETKRDKAGHDEPQRQDLRQLLCVTIDPVDAKDFDDAISVREISPEKYASAATSVTACAAQKETDAYYELGVHIADVSAYLPWNSPLDIEAQQRGCSAYLADRVIPMFPEELSNDACSLMPRQDRLAMSVLIRLTRSGELIDYTITPSVIRSAARLTYDEVDALLEGTGTASAITPTIEKLLRLANHLAQARLRLRTKRGALDFDTVESRVMLDEHNEPCGISIRKRTSATSLVEEAMLLANECTAQYLEHAHVAAAFRVHEQPSEQALYDAAALLRELNLIDKAQAKRIRLADPFAMQKVLAAVKDTAEEYFVTSLLLKAQSKALYMPYNQGHFALGATAYCHFTSPIRRYPDVVVHRALKACLCGRPFVVSGVARQDQPARLAQICSSASEKERAAEGAARASQRIKMAQYYQQKIGEKSMATVTSCERFGVFVMLDASYAQALIPMKLLGEEWFDFDEPHMMLRSQSGDCTLRPGVRVCVQVRSVQVSQGKIDVALVCD